LTNLDEKKDESEPSLVFRLRQELDSELDRLETVVDQAKDHYDLATNTMNTAYRDGWLKQSIIDERNFTAINLSLYQEIVRTINRDYTLSQIIEDLENKISGKSDAISTQIAEDAAKEFKKRVANLLAKLFIDSGHDAMYGRSGKL
jgi:small-conductance mechanosensitive channel